MNDPSDKIRQNKLGYLFVLGEEVPVLVERLRPVPFGNWLVSDFEVEMTAQIKQGERHAAQCAQRSNEFKWLIAVARPLALEHPDASPSDLIEMLPEPERTKARAIVAAVGDEPANVSIPMMMGPQTDKLQ
jgi:hypothetical protein